VFPVVVVPPVFPVVVVPPVFPVAVVPPVFPAAAPPVLPPGAPPVAGEPPIGLSGELPPSPTPPLELPPPTATPPPDCDELVWSLLLPQPKAIAAKLSADKKMLRWCFIGVLLSDSLNLWKTLDTETPAQESSSAAFGPKAVPRKTISVG